MTKKNAIIQEIQNKLINGNMSVLVGAGFSKNANWKYPSWNELLEDMIIKDVYLDEFKVFESNKLKQIRHKDRKKIKKDFIDKVTKRDGYLEIVDKYIKQKGYPEAITTYIEDKFLPIEESGNLNLELPKLLLSLPWNNVYTTNYDTVLERASNNLGDLSYKTVINSEDLSISTQKRIIKLHGSLRTKEERRDNYLGKYGFDGDSRTQYIIAKKDYETYPEKHSAFTHLMRIALLQESFCLIGFSGDDPNFLNWIKWVKNILKGKDKKL